jgi:predicted transcriptional regulator
VVEGSKLVGCITLERIKNLSAEERAERTVGDVAEACTEKNTIRADADAMEALSRMSRDNSRMMVVDDGHLQGIIALRDLMRFFSLKIALEEGEGTAGQATSTQQEHSPSYQQAGAER